MSEPTVVPDLPDTCWPVDWSCIKDADDIDPVVKNRAEALAAQTLRTLTGGRVGGCPRTVRPCAERGLPGGYLEAPVDAAGGWMRPVILPTGAWINVTCGSHRSACGCTSTAEVVLPGPVGSITSVVLDGATLSPLAYRVDDGNRLVRTDGGTWPLCQDMTLDEGEGTFLVTYTQGAKVDGLAAYAAGLLAGEFAKACSGKTCRLPSGVTSIVRNGVSMDVTTGMFPGGVTGIREIDAWIRTWNPYSVITPAGVYSVDRPTPRVTTWRA